LELITRGKTKSEIAAELSLSPKTVLTVHAPNLARVMRIALGIEHRSGEPTDAHVHGWSTRSFVAAP
jgi:FixJ family two-component response regulator